MSDRDPRIDPKEGDELQLDWEPFPRLITYVVGIKTRIVFWRYRDYSRSGSNGIERFRKLAARATVVRQAQEQPNVRQ